MKTLAGKNNDMIRNVKEEWLFDMWNCATLDNLEKKVQSLEARGVDKNSILLVIGTEEVRYFGETNGILYLEYEDKNQPYF